MTKDPTRSRTVLYALPSDFSGWRAGGRAAVPEKGWPVLRGGYGKAALFPPPVTAPLLFDQLVLSANADIRGNGVLRVEVSVPQAGRWSPWFAMADLKRRGGASVPSKPLPQGEVGEDLLKLKTKASAFRLRFVFSGPAGSRAALKLAAVCLTDTSIPYSPAALDRGPYRGGFRLKAEPVSQMRLPHPRCKDMCSPVSVSMALSAIGLPTEPLRQAAAAIDGAADIYGNWTLNARAAALRGAAAWYARFNTFAEAEAVLRRGLPLAVSLTFGPGELRGSPLKKGTRGHFVLLKGFDARGNAVCNEPAVKTGRAERTYRREEFARAWFRNKYGAAYIIVPDPSVFAAVASPVASLYSAPAVTAAQRKKRIESQLLMNEAARPLAYTGGWTRVEALEQPHKSGENRGPAGCYAGFLRSDALRADPLPPHNYCVRSKSAAAASAGGKIKLSAGTRFYAAPAGRGLLRAWLAGGRLALIKRSDCLPFPPPDRGERALRRSILAAARQFLGDKYFWGGRSCHGPDCSGLVGVACRAHGLDLPRNADDQWRLAPPLRWRDLKPGDLVFSSKPGKPREIDHVMFYSGGGRLLEATGESGDVREIPFEKKFGAVPPRDAKKTILKGKTVYFAGLKA
ncbi:MAG: hypothetical protein FD189_2303 [Elusimicrobia bacterium]|nr:MAG: hypothetical protein FD154_2313 [Elusimicrobiota bacterium]KAF0153742.1 MAG: hypothetical protein FD189_2303 [Elusimicrobiota bacterium]